MKLKCLIIDDEPIARDIIESYIVKIEALQLVAECNSAFEALNILHTEKVDILFLDIKMPVLTGLDMLKTIENKPHVILTTAFSEFGAESYEYGVTDYLLKPIAFERFLKAVNKILIPQSHNIGTNTNENTSLKPNFIFLKSDKKVYKFNYDEILYFQGSGNYVKVISKNEKPILVLNKLTNLILELPEKNFVRVHKSYIVNINNISQIEGNRIRIANTEIPIGQMYKDKIIKKQKG